MSALHDIDGIVLLLIAAIAGVVFFLVALAVEVWRAGELRRQARRREALRRYINLVDRQAADLLRRCRQPHEWEA